MGRLNVSAAECVRRERESEIERYMTTTTSQSGASGAQVQSLSALSCMLYHVLLLSATSAKRTSIRGLLLLRQGEIMTLTLVILIV